ncbi:hypothetical protein FRC09_001879 [Ceratobasidium sp. 395]|nr:hypothetical protein FRC09_001879 [Ceratobasidium sp. 395]
MTFDFQHTTNQTLPSGWDPRGVGRSYPLVTCFKDAQEERSFWHGTVPDAGLEARGDFTDPEDIKNFYSQEPEVDRLLGELSQRCSKLSPDFLQYVGTDAAVWDLLSLNAYFSPAGHYLINYWGFSYGTAIGAYFVNMFPEYVGRVILDGVVDPVFWANKPAHEIWAINVESTDKGLAGFIGACDKAGPKGCAFALGGPSDLGKKIHEMIDLAYNYKKYMKGKFGSAYIRDTLFQGMYTPTTWVDLAKSLQACWDFLNSNPGSQLEYCYNPGQPTTPNDYSFQAVTCADAADSVNVTTKMVFEELVNVTRDVSHTFGPSWGIGGLYCHRWPVRSAHRYQGPWNRKSLRNKILVIGNDGDPVTPLRSAKSVASAFGDSAVLIEQDSFGHSSLAMHSDCTWNAIRDYFLDRPFTMVGRVCKADQTIFPGVTMSMVTSLVANSSSSSGTRSLGGNPPDTQLRFTNHV